MKQILLESGNCIWIGNNASENFQLIDQSKPNDLWFHVKSHPSCHVILSGTNFTKDEIIVSARHCKMNSKFSNYRQITIQYLPLKFVQKTATLGQVILRSKSSEIIV